MKSFKLAKIGENKNIEGIVSLIIAIILARTLGFGMVFLVASFFIGLYLPRLYLKKWKISKKGLARLAWANIFTWFVPIIGVFTFGLAIGSMNNAGVISEKEKNKYLVLSVIGAILSIINAMLGVMYT